MPRLFPTTVLAAALAVVLLGPRATAQPPERFTAAAINMNNGRAGSIEIVINRWSTAGERERLMQTMLERGPDKLLDVLQDLPRVGYFRTPDSLAWDIHSATATPGKDGGEQITLITDRRIGFWEAARQPRSIDYPFTVIELHLNADGEGEGKMSVATKIIADKNSNTVVLENYNLQPVQLTNVKRERATR
jgi:hypothetical protein